MKDYFHRNPIKNKAIAQGCGSLFCMSYEAQIRRANAINTNGNKIHHVVKIGGKQSVIILN